MTVMSYRDTALFSLIIRDYSFLAWKSIQSNKGFFAVGLDTPFGQIGSYCDMRYWDLFNCKSVEETPNFDDIDNNFDKLLNFSRLEAVEYFCEKRKKNGK